jgi:hypothetical protein
VSDVPDATGGVTLLQKSTYHAVPAPGRDVVQLSFLRVFGFQQPTGFRLAERNRRIAWSFLVESGDSSLACLCARAIGRAMVQNLGVAPPSIQTLDSGCLLDPNW